MIVLRQAALGEMRVVDVVDADFVHTIKDVAQIGFIVHARAPLLRRRHRVGQAGAQVKVQPVQMCMGALLTMHNASACGLIFAPR